MKRTLAIILALMMVLPVLSGCDLGNLSGTMVDSSFTGTIAARITLGESDPIYYTTFAEAWDLANRNPELEAVITLMSDIKAENNKFGNNAVLSVTKRSTPLTLDMNGFSIDKANTSAQNDGAIFSIYNACDFTIKNGTLTGGYNSSVGGCIFVDSADVYLHLENVTIKGNKTASQGGAMFISAAGCVELTDCTVEDNSASDNGGAFFMTGNKSTVTLNNVTVQNNNSGKNGGAMFIYGSDSTVTLNDTSIISNSSKMAGGIHLDENDGKMASLILSGSIDISGNYITDGGDCDTSNLLVSPYPNNSYKLVITDLDNGSNIYVSFEGNMPYTLIDKIPEDLNAASVFYADSTKNVLNISDSSIKFEPAGDIVASVVIDNQATLYKDFDSAWNAANAAEEKTAYLTLYQDVKISDCQSEGEYKKEGALYPGDKEDDTWLVFNMNGHTIDRGISNASKYGMIFYIYRNTRLILENGTLTGGKCKDQGGAVYCCDDDAVLVFRDMTLKANFATNDGSAIYIDDMDSITLEGKTVIENNRVGTGGSKTTSAVNLEDGDIYLRGEIFIRNNKGPVNGYDNNLVLRHVISASSKIKDSSEIYITDCTCGNSTFFTGEREITINTYDDNGNVIDSSRVSQSLRYRRFTEYGCGLLIDYSSVNMRSADDVFKFDMDMAGRGYVCTNQRCDSILGVLWGFGWVKSETPIDE